MYILDINLLLLFLTLIIGFFLGSFLNVLADRLPNDRSILGRSHCEYCKKTLSWIDLIPLLSFVYLRGKCRYCQRKLSYQYPLAELLTGFLFGLTYLAVSGQIFNQFLNLNSLIINLILSLVLVSCLIVIFFADLRYGLIPDQIIAVGSVVALIWLVLFNQPMLMNHALAALGALLFFLLIFILTRRRGMGFGDVKLAFLLGLFLGFPGIALALYIAFLTGGMVGIILILWKKKKLKSAVPFGPFLVLGAFLSFFFSPVLIPKIIQFF